MATRTERHRWVMTVIGWLVCGLILGGIGLIVGPKQLLLAPLLLLALASGLWVFMVDTLDEKVDD